MGNQIGEQLSEFQQKVAIAWTQMEMKEWKRLNPRATDEEKEKAFIESLEQGICVSLKLRVD